MAIKVGGTSIISDDKNISNVGIVTIGASSSGKLNVGSGVTATGDGTLSIAGTVYAFDVVTPLKIDSFSPSDGSTNVSVNTDIRITFDKSIGIGSTGFVRIKVGSGNDQDVYGVGSTFISRTDLNRTLVITPSQSFTKGVPGVANTITTIVDAGFIDDPAFTGINTTGSNVTYSFEIEETLLGDAYEGGYLICVSGGTQWIVAPSSTEVTEGVGAFSSAATCAQTVTGCTGWFVPNGSRMLNPGFQCRQYWDTYSATWYGTSDWDGSRMTIVNMGTGAAGGTGAGSYPRRAFRCVTY
jgi:hypothetical protein